MDLTVNIEKEENVEKEKRSPEMNTDSSKQIEEMVVAEKTRWNELHAMREGGCVMGGFFQSNGREDFLETKMPSFEDIVGEKEEVAEEEENCTFLEIGTESENETLEEIENEKSKKPVEVQKSEEKENFSILVKVFLPTCCFWMLYDQQTSSWIEQANKMDNLVFGYKVLPAQMQSFNAVLTLLFIPLFTKLVYPFVGVGFTPIRKMAAGMVCAALSFFFAAGIEIIRRERSLSILWQVPQYVYLTAGEILLSVTGLEFAYTNSPDGYKSLVLSVWLLMVALGNLIVIVITTLNIFRSQAKELHYFLFYGLLCLLGSFVLFRTKFANKN